MILPIFSKTLTTLFIDGHFFRHSFELLPLFRIIRRPAYVCFSEKPFVLLRFLCTVSITAKFSREVIFKISRIWKEMLESVRIIGHEFQPLSFWVKFAHHIWKNSRFCVNFFKFITASCVANLQLQFTCEFNVIESKTFLVWENLWLLFFKENKIFLIGPQKILIYGGGAQQCRNTTVPKPKLYSTALKIDDIWKAGRNRE